MNINQPDNSTLCDLQHGVLSMIFAFDASCHCASFNINRSIQFRALHFATQISPLFVNNVVPMCSWQYERVFNTTRIPRLEKDKLLHLHDSSHVVVYHRGRYFRCPVVADGERLSARELQQSVSLVYVGLLWLLSLSHTHFVRSGNWVNWLSQVISEVIGVIRSSTSRALVRKASWFNQCLFESAEADNFCPNQTKIIKSVKH